MNSIVDDIGVVVQSMRTGLFDQAYDEKSTDPPFLFTGRRQEIVNETTKLRKVAETGVNVFPMVALNSEIQYERRGNIVDYTLNILLAIQTKADLSTEEREEVNFIPFLYPLYDSFIRNFGKVGLFFWQSEDLRTPPHTPINRYYYGKGDAAGTVGNIFNEPVDGIELVGLKFSRDILCSNKFYQLKYEQQNYE